MNKEYKATIATLASFLLLLPLPIAAQASTTEVVLGGSAGGAGCTLNGSGTSGDPWQVGTGAEFATMKDCTTSGQTNHFKITNNFTVTSDQSDEFNPRREDDTVIDGGLHTVTFVDIEKSLEAEDATLKVKNVNFVLQNSNETDSLFGTGDHGAGAGGASVSGVELENVSVTHASFTNLSKGLIAHFDATQPSSLKVRNLNIIGTPDGAGELDLAGGIFSTGTDKGVSIDAAGLHIDYSSVPSVSPSYTNQSSLIFNTPIADEVEFQKFSEVSLSAQSVTLPDGNNNGMGLLFSSKRDSSPKASADAFSQINVDVSELIWGASPTAEKEIAGFIFGLAYFDGASTIDIADFRAKGTVKTGKIKESNGLTVAAIDHTNESPSVTFSRGFVDVDLEIPSNKDFTYSLEPIAGGQNINSQPNPSTYSDPAKATTYSDLLVLQESTYYTDFSTTPASDLDKPSFYVSEDGATLVNNASYPDNSNFTVPNIRYDFGSSTDVTLSEFTNNAIRTSLSAVDEQSEVPSSFATNWEFASGKSPELAFVSSASHDTISSYTYSDSTVNQYTTVDISPSIAFGEASTDSVFRFELASSSPALPTGLVVDTMTGKIVGTPTVAAAANTYTVEAFDQSGNSMGTGTVNLTVNSNPFQLTLFGNYSSGTTSDASTSTDVLTGPTGIAVPKLDDVADAVFEEWNTAVDGSGTSVDPDTETVTLEGNASLYARWAPKVEFTFSPGTKTGVTGTVPSITTGQNISVTLPNGEEMTAPGYFVSGWATSDGGSQNKELLSSFSKSSDQEFFAVWSSHDVTYKANFSGDISTDIVESGASDYVAAGSDLFARDGQTITAWTTAADGTGDSFTPGQALDLVAELGRTAAANLDLYAQWGVESSGSAPAIPAPVIPGIGGGSSGGSTDSDVGAEALNETYSPGDTASIPLDLQGYVISGVKLDGVSAPSFEVNSDELSFEVPDVETGDYPITLMTDKGSITYQSVVVSVVAAKEEVILGQAESKGWTSQMSETQVKMYMKNINVGNKYQFFVNGTEIAWVRKNSSSDIDGSNLRQALGTDYMVRTVDLGPGKNALEIYIDGERVWRAAYTG